MSERTRAYFYRVATAAIAVLVLYGVIGGGEAATWALLAAAILGVSEGALATAYTSTGDDSR